MLAALESANAVDKRNLHKFVSGRQRHRILPAFRRRFVHAMPRLLVLGANVEIHILLEILYRHDRVIDANLDLLDRVVRDRRNVVSALFEEVQHVLGQAPGESEARVVGLEHYLGVRFGRLDLGNLGRTQLGKVGLELLCVLQATHMVHRLHITVSRPNQD